MSIPLFAINIDEEFRFPLGTGLIIVNLKKKLSPELVEQIDFSPGYFNRCEDVASMIKGGKNGSIFLFSDYDWNVQRHLALSEDIKRRSPGSLVVHGGPSIPCDPEDLQVFLAENQAVDVVCLGDGEETVADLLDGYLKNEDLTEIAGCVTRESIQQGHLPKKRFTEELSGIASPYLENEFAPLFKNGPPKALSLETNRGCPYHCAFCNWGQSTRRRTRLFPMERIQEELEWMAFNKIPVLELTDSNFGMLERDVEIAEYICKIKEKYGFPYELCSNFAKDFNDRVIEIIRITQSAGLVSQAILSIQTLNSKSLKSVGRKNFDENFYTRNLAKYRELALPVTVEYMVGLPFCSVESFKYDLQWAIDNNLGVYVHSTILLPNTEISRKDNCEKYGIKVASESRFSDEKYLKEAGLNTIRPNQVVAADSFNEDDFLEMLKLTSVFHIFYGESILKYIMGYLHYECGIPNIEFLHDLQKADLSQYDLLRSLRDMGDDPASTISLDGDRNVLWSFIQENRWFFLYAEVRRYIERRYGRIAGLETAIRAQQFVLAFYGRCIPDQIILEHDFVSFWEDHFAGRKEKKLVEYGETQLTVTDPLQMCQKSMEPDFYEPHHGHYELTSELNSIKFGVDLNKIM